MRRFAVSALLLLNWAASAPAAPNPVVSAAKRTAMVKSSTMQMTITTMVPGAAKTTLTGTGAQRGTSVELALRTRAQGVPFRMDAVLLEERGSFVIYMRSPVFAQKLPRGKSWLRVDLSKQAASLGVDFSSLVNTSQTFAPLEKGLVSTKRLGHEGIAGTATTRYRAIVDVRRAARAVPSYGKQVAAVERATGVRFGRSPYDVWIGRDGRIRRIRFSTPTVANAVRGTTTQTITFTSFNGPVSISAPPRARVFSP